MGYRTCKNIRDKALQNGDFRRLGAVEYIIYLNSRYKNGEEISESEIHNYYDAKRSILEYEKFHFDEYSKKRKRAEKKHSGADSQYIQTDPSRDLPF
jgi:hypothetical protein